jgi:asparagine synthase (glutamine-hydrolysing)
VGGFAGIFVAGRGGEEGLRSRLAPVGRGAWLDPAAGVAFTVGAGGAERGGATIIAGARFSIAYVGELYNRVELRSELAREGVGPGRGGDAAVVLGVLERWGVEPGLHRLQGPFALAVWDRGGRMLHLIRDRLGLKPLFVEVRGGVVRFGSRLRYLAAAPGFEREVDRRALCQYLRYLYVPAPHSIYRGVHKVRPGHLLTITDPAAPLPASRPYWSLREVAERGIGDPFRGELHEAADEAERLLAAAIRGRMVGLAPAGALLSGGLDSTSVVALLGELAPRPVRTFVVSYAEAEHDEAVHAARIAAHLGTEHTEFRVTGADARAVIPDLAEIFDEPYADAGALPAYLIATLARQELAGAFVGDGGDEIFGGYNRYTYGEKVVRRLGRVPRPARRLVAAGIAGLSTESWARAHRALAPLLPPPLQQRLAGDKLAKIGRLLEARTPTMMYRALLSAWHHPTELVGDGAEEPGVLEEILDAESPASLIDRMILADQMVYLPDDQLAKAEQVALAAGLALRAPLLDHHLVELAWRLPTRLKIDAGKGKLPLREIIYRRVPRELVERPKMGFSVPLASWLRGPLRPWAEELLSTEALARDGLLRPEPVRAAWSRLLRGRTDLALGLWAVLVFQLWRERWL